MPQKYLLTTELPALRERLQDTQQNAAAGGVEEPSRAGSGPMGARHRSPSGFTVRGA